MDISQFSKNHGSSILGAGLLSLAASLAFVGKGVFERFDRVEELAESLEQSTASVRVMQGEIKKDLTVLRAQFPALGEETGAAAAGAIKVLEEQLRCDEDNQQDCETGVRGAVLDRVKKMKPEK